jgi:quinol monooxygenase YgiN
MIIVGGTFDVEPDQRDEFLASRHDGMRRSRAEPGCLEYTLSPDPLDPGRVMLFERWESQEHLDAHLAALRGAAAAPGIAPKSMSIKLYDVSGERSLS